jgi:hypothetical protein
MKEAWGPKFNGWKGFGPYKPVLQHRTSCFIVYNNALYKNTVVTLYCTDTQVCLIDCKKRRCVALPI